MNIVICVSDNQETSELIQLILQHKQVDIDFQSAKVGQDGIELACKEKPNLIIVDVPFTEEEKAELMVKEMRQIPVLSNTPIIALGTPRFKYDGPPIGLGWVSHECEKFLNKPFVVEELVETITHILNNNDLLNES